MPQITLVPWSAAEFFDNGGSWNFAGAQVSCLRALGDGNFAQRDSVVSADSNSLRATQWRVEGTGAVPNWANKVINSVLVQFNLTNIGPGNPGVAFVSANESLTYAEQLMNGEIVLPANIPTWVTAINGAHASVIAAILAGNYLTSLIHFDHWGYGNTTQYDQSRVVVTYTDNIPRASLAMEA